MHDIGRDRHTLTDRFIDRLCRLRETGLTEHALVQAKKRLLDYLASAFAGATILREERRQYLACLGRSIGSSTIINHPEKADVYSAILLNGMSAHAAELDDGHRQGMLHLGSVVIPALLAVAELEQIGGYDLLSGIIVGYEAAIRLACSVQPSHKWRGYHATGTCGVIGASMGIATALKYTKQQMKATLSAAVSSASGVLEIQEDGSQLKPFNAGRASLDGFVAALVGRTGLAGPDDILGGRRGFLAVMSDDPSPDRMVADDQVLGIEEVYMKPYASCRHSHPAIEAAMRICKAQGIGPENVRSVVVSTYDAAVKGHDHKVIRGIGSAKMSIPYCVAVAIQCGKVGIEEFSQECIVDKRVAKLMEKVTVISDPELTALLPNKRVAKVTIETNDNRVFAERADYAKGEPENPMPMEEIEEKLVSMVLHAGRDMVAAERIIEVVESVEDRLMELYALV